MAEPKTIEVRVEKVEQLFNSMDPSPFHSKHLDSDAEDFIVSAASRHKAEDGYRLVVHLAEEPPPGTRVLVEEAIHNYFEFKAERALWEFRRLMGIGRDSLIIGLLFLGACIWGAQALPPIGGPALTEIVREGLLIAGWVAMWRPMQTFLYDWWPILRQRRLYIRLAGMSVTILNP